MTFALLERKRADGHDCDAERRFPHRAGRRTRGRHRQLPTRITQHNAGGGCLWVSTPPKLTLVGRTTLRLKSLTATATDRLVKRWVFLAATVSAAVLVCVPAAPIVVVAPAGLWVLFGAPIMLWCGVAHAFVSTRDGRLIVAVGLTVLTDIVVALVVNTALPLAGIAAPLRAMPLAAASVATIVILAAATPTRPAAQRNFRAALRAVPGLTAVLGLGAPTVILAVAGPVRLNNGLGGTVAVLTLLLVAALMVLLLVQRGRYGSGVIGLGIFFAALAVLLLTSLRGWYITGHDIQREYGVFQLANQAGVWSIAAFRNPYNACLSVNLLPTSISRLTGISGIYVFKAVYPVLFAVAPVALYRAVRHGAPQTIALLSAFYFVAFPTFFTDMVFLARQEVAFLLLGCSLVILADPDRPRRVRRIVVTALLAGIVLSHYSTTYVVLASFGLACLLAGGWRLLFRLRTGRPAAPSTRPFVTWWMLAVVALAAAMWTGPATHTDKQAHATARSAVLELLGKKSASGSSDTAYSIVGGQRFTAEQRLDAYASATTSDTAAGRADGRYLPLDKVQQHPVPAVEPPNMPLTALGDLLQKFGVDVSGLNALIRQSAARLLQILLVVGLVISVVCRRRPVLRPSLDQLVLAGGALGVIGVLTVLPDLSVDYGVLRAFQQGLFFFAPFIAAASVWLFRWAGARTIALAGAMVIFLFLDLVGVVPKLLGGYPAQLHLADAGQYYDIYYLHPEERSGIGWLVNRTTEDERDTIQSEVQSDRYIFGPLQNQLRDRSLNDIYPTLVGADSYVFLGYTATRKGEATMFYRGDLVTYRYPVELLDATKDKVYSNEGAEVYR
jgi:uncharacterized membrane protein